MGIVLAVGGAHVAVEGGALAGDALLWGEGLFDWDLLTFAGVGGRGLEDRRVD